jgi:hypothetical protein
MKDKLAQLLAAQATNSQKRQTLDQLIASQPQRRQSYAECREPVTISRVARSPIVNNVSQKPKAKRSNERFQRTLIRAKRNFLIK